MEPASTRTFFATSLAVVGMLTFSVAPALAQAPASAEPPPDATVSSAPATAPPPAPTPAPAAAAPPPPTSDEGKPLLRSPLDEDPYGHEATAAHPIRAPLMVRLMQNRLTWDLNFEAGYGHVFSSPTRGSGFLRPGLGATLVQDPFWLTLRGTYEYSRLSDATIGVQAELALFEAGLWVQVGGMMDATKGHRAGFMTALGFAIFGAELEYRNAEQTGKAWAIYGKLRLPISALVQVFTR